LNASTGNRFSRISPNIDADNPKARRMPIEQLRITPQEEHGLKGFAREKLVEYELGYRHQPAFSQFPSR